MCARGPSPGLSPEPEPPRERTEVPEVPTSRLVARLGRTRLFTSHKTRPNVAAHQPEALAQEHLEVEDSAKPAGARAAPEMKMQLSSCEVRLQSARDTG